jgi:AcrR family transcriptional regulator
MPRKPQLLPRKRPLQERSRATVQAILEATTYILLEHGYAALTTNGVAERAGVNIATLYQYFPNKEAIVLELQREHVAQARAAALAAFSAARPSRSFKSKVRAIVEAVIAEHKVAPRLHQIFTEQAQGLGAPAVETAADAAIQRAEQFWLAEASAKLPDPELTLWIAKTALHAVLDAALVERPHVVDTQAFVAELTLLAAHSLRRAAG